MPFAISILLLVSSLSITHSPTTRAEITAVLFAENAGQYLILSENKRNIDKSSFLGDIFLHGNGAVIAVIYC